MASFGFVGWVQMGPFGFIPLVAWGDGRWRCAALADGNHDSWLGGDGDRGWCQRGAWVVLEEADAAKDLTDSSIYFFERRYVIHVPAEFIIPSRFIAGASSLVMSGERVDI